MNLRLFVMFTVMIKTFLIYPGRIKAQVPDAVSSVQQHAPKVVLKCPTNLSLCECSHGLSVNCRLQYENSGFSMATTIELEQQFAQELSEIKEESRKGGELGPIDVHSFSMSPLNFLKIDLSIFHGFSIKQIKILPEVWNTSFLRSITGALTRNTKDAFQNVSTVFIIDNRDLDDDGFGDTLKAFSSSTELKILWLARNAFRGNDDENSEFLPGLSALVSLEKLSLSFNKITRVFTGHFENLSKLRTLDLSNNRIMSVKGHLFFVNNNLNNLTINLADTFLDENSFGPVNKTKRDLISKNFTNKGARGIMLDLGGNKLSSLPLEIFHDFLYSNKDNVIDLRENPLVCDKRVKWLRESDNTRFSNQVKDAKCSNLQGAPLFKKSDIGNNELFCPVLGQIMPCTCVIEPELKQIGCSGETIVQKDVDHTLEVLRQERRISQNQLLDIEALTFTIRHTDLSEFDVTSLLNLKIDTLEICDNKFLAVLKSARMTPPGTIHVKNLVIENNPELDDQGLGDALKLFSPTMQILRMSGNSLMGHFTVESSKSQNSNSNSMNSTKIETMEREFFPGLAQFSQIRMIDLQGNKIEHLGVGRFRKNSELKDLRLQGNKILSLQKNAFFKSKSEQKFGVSLTSGVQIEGMNLSKFYNENFVQGANMEAIKINLSPSSSGSLIFCPPAQEIRPCTCTENYTEIVCSGSSVTQEAIETLFQKLKEKFRKAANVSTVTIENIKIFSTMMIELDLSPLIDCRISTLFIGDNFILNKITSSASASSKILVDQLIIESNPRITDSGIASLLSYFEPQIQVLNLASNSLILKKPLNGLSTLKKLKVLNLRDNEISQLSPQVFSGVINRQLEQLDLSENKIDQIDEDAFGFSSKDDFTVGSSTPLVINLNFNHITDTSFPEGRTGLENFQRPIVLNLVHNKMTTLSFNPFNLLFTQRSGNLSLDLYGNPLDCDWRLSWLEKTGVFSNSSNVSIENAECANEPRKFIHNFPKSTSNAGNFCSHMTLKDVAPCSCERSSNLLDCSGDQVDDQGFQALFKRIKRLGPFCGKLLPNLDQIVIRSTKLTKLDLTDFFNICLLNLTSLIVDSNLNLTHIVGPSITNFDIRELLNVKNLEITSNPLRNEGLGSTLQYFSGKMNTLILNGNQLEGPLSLELLPGLSNLKNLTRIELESNKITKLEGGIFNASPKLGHVSLVNNAISKIGQNAFLFHTEKDDQEVIVIDLTSNNLTADSFDQESGIDQVNHRVNLKLGRNHFSTIPAIPFESFLSNSLNNVVHLEENPLICDESMMWLHGRKREFRDKIQGAECDDEPIFEHQFFETPEPYYKTWIYMTISVVVVFAILAGIGIQKYLQLKTRLRNLTPTEIREFFDGNPKAAKLENPKVDDLPFVKTINPKHLDIQPNCELGKGEFGVVCLGVLKGQHVAVKTILKKTDIKYFKEFLRELKVMQHIGHHQHVVSFLGAEVSKIGDRIIHAVMELGVESLENHFKRNPIPISEIYEIRSQLKSKFIGWAIQIASGMEFLESKKVIHADLAARNVLLFSENVLKITDFGLARKLYKQKSVYSRNQDSVLPYAWLAIESITRMEFTHKSDVWTFAVLLWEIFSYGKVPFAILASDLTKFIPLMIQNKIVLEMPAFADTAIYEMMGQCWDHEPNQRPTFKNLRKFFQEYWTSLEARDETYACKIYNEVEDFGENSEIESVSVNSTNVEFQVGIDGGKNSSYAPWKDFCANQDVV